MIRLAAAALALSACTPQIKQDIDAGATGQAPQAATPVEGKCDAAPVRDLIGRQRSEALGTEARQRSGARVLRWLPPGAIMTMDYREDRLNVKLDASDTVIEFNCG